MLESTLALLSPTPLRGCYEEVHYVTLLRTATLYLSLYEQTRLTTKNSPFRANAKTLRGMYLHSPYPTLVHSKEALLAGRMACYESDVYRKAVYRCY